MSEPRLVPQLTHPFAAVGRRVFWSCHVCGFKASAIRESALAVAMDAHRDYVNQTADRTVDEHFAEGRLDRLIEA